MFTGIVQSTAHVRTLQHEGSVLRYSLEFCPEFLSGLALGASVSVDGCCQTVVKIEGSCVFFQAIPETLKRTQLSTYEIGQKVNVERSARFGDEIGGHILSGHVFGTAKLAKLEMNEASSTAVLYLTCPKEWMAYIFEKGFIALDGVSLTVVDIFAEGGFTVHLIPETLSRTTFGEKKEGAFVNVEIDSFTQTVVHTVERVLKK